MSPLTSLELVPLYVFVGFFTSWNYHSCRGNLARSGKIDLCEKSPKTSEYGNCVDCPKYGTMFANYDFNESELIDKIFAAYAILLTLINIIPLREELSTSFRTFGLIWIVGSLILAGSAGDYVSLIIIIPLVILVLVFFFQTLKTYKSRTICWPIAIAFTIIAVVFFLQPSDYWVYHSLWHIFGALAGAFFLAGGVNIKVEKIKQNSWGNRHFWKHVLTDK